MDEIIRGDIKRYWQIIIGRRYIFIAVALSCLSIIVWGSYFVPELYEAQSTVLIERNVINRLVQNIAITPSLNERLRVLSQTMTSRNLLMKVISDLDLDVNRNDPADMEKFVVIFQNNTKIKMVSKGGSEADWFSVTYRDKDPKLARDYINTLVRRYVEENISAKRDESYDANKFLSEQRSFFKEKMDAAEDKILEFRRNKGIFIVMDEKVIVEEIEAAQANIEEIRLQRMELEAKKSLTEKQLKDEKPYTVALFGKTRAESLNDRLIMLQNRLNELLIKYTENYPEVIKVKAEIEALKNQIQSSSVNAENTEEIQGNETEMSTLNPFRQKLKEDLATIDLDLAALSAKEKRLSAIIEEKKDYLKNIPADKKILTDLVRERDTYRKIDDEIVLRLGQSEVSKQMEMQDKTATFRILDPAILPNKPVSPNRVLIIILGMVAGIGAGFVAVFLLDSFDSSIKTVDELKQLVSVPVLAVIPQIVTDEDISKKKKMDRKVYAISLGYLSIIGILFIKEAIDKYL